MLQKACADALSSPLQIGGKLAEKQAGDWIRRLSRPDRSWQQGRNHGSGSKTVETDDTPGLMNDHDGAEALLLIGKSPRLQPMIERDLTAGELRYIMGCGNGFWR